MLGDQPADRPAALRPCLVRQDVDSVIIFACATVTPTTRRESSQQAADYVK